MSAEPVPEATPSKSTSASLRPNDRSSAGLVSEDLPRQRPTQFEEEELHDRRGNRALRDLYAKRCLALAAAQLLFVNTVVVLLGVGVLEDPGTLFRAFLSGTFLQALAVLHVVMRYLFPRKSRAIDGEIDGS